MDEGVEIINEERPANQKIEQYIDLLNRYLAPHGARVSITLRDSPIDIHCHYGREGSMKEWVERHWIDDLIVSVNGEDIHIQGDAHILLTDQIGREKHIAENAWLIAASIQDELYRGRDRDDAYWELWDKHPSRES